MSLYEIYTDGSSKGNGTKLMTGGWGYIVFKDGKEIFCDSGYKFYATNNQMELEAAIRALYDINHCNWLNISDDDEFIVYSDSAYLVNCYQSKWYVNWEKNNWINSKKQPVLNKELWEELIPYFKSGVSFMKVKGHSTNELNNRVDYLAQHAAEKGAIIKETMV